MTKKDLENLVKKEVEKLDKLWKQFNANDDTWFKLNDKLSKLEREIAELPLDNSVKKGDNIGRRKNSSKKNQKTNKRSR